MYRILTLIHTDETPFWAAETIKAIEETGMATCTIAKINLSKDGGNTNIRYFSWITWLGNFFNLKNSDKYFDHVNIKALHTFSSGKNLENILLQEEFDYVIWLGDSNRVNEIKSYCSKPLWYFSNMTTVKNRIDGAFIGLFNLQHWTPIGLYESFQSSAKLIGWAVSNNSSYSLQTARASYASVIGIPARVLLKQLPSESVLPWNDYKNQSKINVNFWFIFKLFMRFVTVIYYKIFAKFSKPRWVLGLVKENFENVTQVPDFNNIRILKHPDKNKGWADSFIVEDKGEIVIIAEEIDKKGRGHIVGINVEENRVSSYDILKEKYHLSYPYIFKYKKKWYMTPESSENKKISLYIAEKFPHKWKWQSDILQDIEMVDATIFEYEDKWWLFANGKKYADSFNEELHIYHADSPLGDWEAHVLNPVKNDVRSTRCAGRPQSFNNIFYRPTQDCSLRYGYRIIWNKILKLSTSEFEEEVVGVTNPNWIEGIDSTHTIDVQNNYFVLDAHTK